MELALKNQDFLPRNFDVEEMKKNVELYKMLYSIIQPMTILMEKINDTYREIDAEAYSAGLLVYHNAKQNGKDVGGFDSVIDEFSKRFVKKASEKNK